MNVQPRGATTIGEPLSNSPASMSSPGRTPTGVLKVSVGPSPLTAELAARKTITSFARAARFPWVITTADSRNKETKSAVILFVSGTGLRIVAPVDRVRGVESEL